MVEDVNSSILLVLVMFMISVLGMSFFAVYEWSDVGQAGKAMVAVVRGLVDDGGELSKVVEQSNRGRVLGAQNVRPVDFVDYPVVHISSGVRSVFEPTSDN